jgi:magnesium chelatase family protein
LDRFDLIVRVGRVEAVEYAGAPGEPSAAVSKRVLGARVIQGERGQVNRLLAPSAEFHESPAAKSLVADAVGRGFLTARGADRVRRVGRTVADLASSQQVEEEHLAEAIALRGEWRDD